MKVTSEDIKNIIDSSIEIENVNTLDDKKNFKEQGLDSLETFNVLLALEEKYEISIPDDQTENLDSIQNIIDYLENI